MTKLTKIEREKREKYDVWERKIMREEAVAFGFWLNDTTFGCSPMRYILTLYKQFKAQQKPKRKK